MRFAILNTQTGDWWAGGFHPPNWSAIKPVVIDTRTDAAMFAAHIGRHAQVTELVAEEGADDDA